MPLLRIVGVGLIALGALLLWQGWQMRQSLASRITDAIQGSPSDQVLWLLGGGALAAVVGLVLLLRR
jgi:uncharacterized protein YjeT (DUF2065 family)